MRPGLEWVERAVCASKEPCSLVLGKASEAKRESALICWASATKMSAPQIAALVGTDESHVRKVIQAFNERGFGSLDRESRGGRPRRITDEQRARIVAVAGARPDTFGVAATRWSLKRLARYPREQRIVQVSPAHLGRILAQAGLSFSAPAPGRSAPNLIMRPGRTRDRALQTGPRRWRRAAKRDVSGGPPS